MKITCLKIIPEASKRTRVFRACTTFNMIARNLRLDIHRVDT